jgi:membrane protein required for colicin V production
MNLVDILIWVVLLAFMVKGFMKGLIREVCSLLGLLMGSWAALKYYHPLALAIRPYIHLPQNVSSVLSFFAVFITIGLLFFFLGRLLTVVFKIMLLGGMNRVGGVIFGMLQGALLLCLLLYFGTAKPMPAKLKGSLTKSSTARAFILCGGEIISGWDRGASGVKESSGGR